MLLYGTQIRGICSLMKEKLCGMEDQSNGNQIQSITDSNKYVKELQERLKIVAEVVNSTANQKQPNYVKAHNSTAKKKHFDVGEKILILEKNTNCKIRGEWKEGTILQQTRDNTYLVGTEENGKRLIHSSMLRKFYTPIQEVGLRINTVKRLLKKETLMSEENDDEDDEEEHANINHVGIYEEDETNDFGNVCEIPVKYKKTPEYINFKEDIERTC